MEKENSDTQPKRTVNIPKYIRPKPLSPEEEAKIAKEREEREKKQQEEREKRREEREKREEKEKPMPYIYRELKGKSITPCFYQYIGTYRIGRVLGDIFTFLIIMASIVVGKNTGNMVMGTISYAVSIGAFIYHYKILHTLYRGKTTGYFKEMGYFLNLEKKLLPMIMLSRFAELYTVFLIALASIPDKTQKILSISWVVPGQHWKILICFLITALIIRFKLKNNFIENKTFSIIKRNSIGQIIVLVLGLFLYSKGTVTLYNNWQILIIAFIVGIGRYALSKNLRNFFKDEKDNIAKKEIAINSLHNNRGIIFPEHKFLSPKEEDDLFEEERKRKEEEKKKREKEAEEERKRQEEAAKTPLQRKREERERKRKKQEEWERKRAADKAYDDYIRNCTKYSDERNAEEKRKKQEEKAYKETERKIRQGESLSDTEKKIVEKTIEESKLTANTDRTKSRR
ncbi:MAG: hypothetical protein NC433_01875 [Clostridiales bacterium]|nr:hypothetical protein [Clostridiales bacterium]